MNTYALHFGSSYHTPVPAREAAHRAIPPHFAGYQGLFVDGDSFVEWGEAAITDPIHVVIVFMAESEQHAYSRAIALLDKLVRNGGGFDFGASCAPTGSDAHEPFAVSLMSNWGCTIAPDGSRTGDSLSWEHASA